MRHAILAALLFISSLCLGQGHTYPATDTDNNFTGHNTFSQLVVLGYNVSQLASLTPFNFQTVTIKDGADSRDCSAGGGNFRVLCQWNSLTSQWTPMSGTIPSFSQIGGNISVTQMNNAINANSVTCWFGDATWKPCGSGGGTGSDWTQITNKPAVFPSDWNIISTKPTIFPSDWSIISSKPDAFPADWNNIINKPTAFASEWSIIQNKPSTFAPSLPTVTAPGGVYMTGDCPQYQHVSGINFTNGQLTCTPDLNSSFQLQANGVTIATGIQALNFIGSAGLQITAAVNNTTGVVTLTVTGSTATQAETPIFSPLPGSYDTTQSVTLTCASPSPTIYYTTDGSTPTHASLTAQPISAGSVTIKAICASSGLADSNVTTGVYALNAPAVTLTPTSQNFGNVKVGTPSTLTTVLRNSGTAVLNISSIAVSGDYTKTTDCGATLAVSVSCNINITFTPSTTGTRNGTLTITDNASGSPHTSSLTGVGIVSTETLLPSSLTFSGTKVGVTATPQALTITNTGSVSIVISSIAITGVNTGDFSQTNNCPGTLNAGGTCSITVSFTPTAAGSRTASVTVTDDATGSPHSSTISGTGITPSETVSPSSLTFSGTKVGTTAATQNVTVTNTGSVPINFSSVTITGTNAGDFAKTNNCSSTLGAGANCTITISFTPSATGSRTATLTVTDDSSGSPRTVTLSGTGLLPTVSLSPASLSFGSQTVGQPTNSQSVTVTNTGSVPLVVSSISIGGTNPGDFSQTNNCSTVAGGGTCSVTVTFTPTTTGARSATVSISDDAASSPQSFGVSGTGLTPTAPAVGLSPTSLTFSSQKLGTTSGSQSITVTNTGTANLTINSVSLTGLNSGDFGQSNTCSVVTPGNTCSITVTFSPTAVGSRTATVSISDNATGSPHTAGLTGTGAVATISISPTSLNMGTLYVGTTSAAQGVTVTNTSAVPMAFSNITISGDFAQTNNCPLGSTLAASGTCTVNVTFTPSTTGSRTGTLTFFEDATGNPHSVSLTGAGVQTTANLSPANYDFGSGVQFVFTHDFTLINTGSYTMNISSIGTSGGAFLVYSQTCGSTLASGASCSITVSATVDGCADPGTHSGALIVNDNATNSPRQSSLSVTAVYNSNICNP